MLAPGDAPRPPVSIDDLSGERVTIMREPGNEAVEVTLHDNFREATSDNLYPLSDAWVGETRFPLAAPEAARGSGLARPSGPDDEEEVQLSSEERAVSLAHLMTHRPKLRHCP